MIILQLPSEFYKLSPEERKSLMQRMKDAFALDLKGDENYPSIKAVFSAGDLYVRKAGYLVMGKLYEGREDLRSMILNFLQQVMEESNELVRQTVVNTIGEIGKTDANLTVKNILEKGLYDPHHKVRNAVIGSLKKMGEVNPAPVLEFSKQFLDHPDPQVRRQVVHGIELRGRTHPEEVLPILEKMQFEKSRLVWNMTVHVLGQISYKEGCLDKVLKALSQWNDEKMISKTMEEILDVHYRYKNFSALSYGDARERILAAGFTIPVNEHSEE